jgi:DNA polymerase-3 subunit delta
MLVWMITTLAGGNNLLLRATLERLVNEFVAEHDDMAVERIDCEEAEHNQITEAIQSMPFLSSKKLVVLNRPGTQKQFIESFENLLESISDSTDVIIIEPKPDKRSSYYKLLQKKTDFKSFDELGPRELPEWLCHTAKLRGGSLGRGDAQYLVERIGVNQQLLSNELDKLLTYDLRITRQTIDLLTEQAPQSTIFQLLDAAFSRNAKRTMDLYHEQRALRVDPVQIIAMLAWQLHILAIVKTASDKMSQSIAQEAGLSPFVVQKSQAAVRNLTLGQLRQWIHDLHVLDVKTKSTSVDPDEALQHFLLTLVS